MLTIRIQSYESFDDNTSIITVEGARDIHLEHSLLSISKWESRWKKPFLTDKPKTDEEIMDYLKCMTISRDVPDMSYLYITIEQFEMINEYISSSMTATTFNEKDSEPGKEILTSELIYYYMMCNNIPFECEKWHLNRLFTLMRICRIKNQSDKKKPINEVVKSNAELNAARKKAMNTRG